MVRRKHADRLLSEINVRNNRRQIRKERILREHNPLALAGCTGGKYQKRQCVRIDGSIVVRVGIRLIFRATCLYQRGNISVLPCLRVQIKNGSFQLNAFSDHFSLFCNISVAEQEGGVRFPNRVCKIVCQPLTVQRHQNRADRLRRVVGNCPFVGCLSDQRAVFSRASHCQQLTCQRMYVIAQLNIADRRCLRLVRIGTEGERIGFTIGVSRPLDQLTHIRILVLFM